VPIELSIDETRAWLTLLHAPGLGGAGIRELLACGGTVLGALAAARRGAPESARAWLLAPDMALVDADLRWLEAPNHHLLVCTSEDFPLLLREISGAPAALFVAGDPTCLWAPQIAIVGARRASSAGLANARAFAKTFAQAGNVVTSGMAEGVDGAAHQGALDGAGKTIAVLGTGPDLIYPRQHKELAARIVENGALVSEFAPGTPGKPEFFPRRNRIIAGLSLGTLVVEAGLNSGSLITARFAAEQGREVFALPGSIHSPLSRGSHQLIRDGARLVETAEEVLDELRGIGGLLAQGLRRRLDGAGAHSSASLTPTPARDPDYLRLLAAVEARASAIDELVAHTGLPAATLSSMLLVLELDGVVTAENGRYSRREV
jgi:DNA processing protein